MYGLGAGIMIVRHIQFGPSNVLQKLRARIYAGGPGSGPHPGTGELWQKTRSEAGVGEEHKPVVPDAPRPLHKTYGPNWASHPNIENIKHEFNKATGARSKGLKQYKQYVQRSNEHYGAVKEAISQGKPVPQAVRNDYPYMQGGGPGSGCHGNDCGRPSTGERTLDPEAAKPIHDWLAMLSQHSKRDALIQEHGKTYTKAISAQKMGQMKLCYMNAYQCVTRNPEKDLTYVEGYATTKDLPIPLEHAWAVDKQGRVIDPTWKDGTAYVGVPFKTSYIQKVALRSRVYGVLSYTNRPLLTGKDKDFKAMAAGGPGSGCKGTNCGRPSGPDSGKTFFVYRLQSPTSNSLVNKNAADLAGIVKFFNSDQQELTQGGDTIAKYRVTNETPGTFGSYKQLRGGLTSHPDGIGRKQDSIKWGIPQDKANWYSFGSKGYKAELVQSVPVSTLEQHAKSMGLPYFGSNEPDDMKVVSRAFSTIKAGGPGSGCHGDNCGRPSLGKTKALATIPRASYFLNPTQLKAEKAYRQHLATNMEGAKAEYREKFGNVLNADNAKELSPDYRKDRSNLAMAVHEPSSFLVKQLFKEELAKPAPEGKANAVFFTAGGAGAGKTTSLSADPNLAKVADMAHIVYDGTLRPAHSAISKVADALAAGKQAVVAFIHRDPEDALMNGIVPRAERTGRTVLLTEVASQYAGVQSSMKALQDTFKDNPNFHMGVIDNSHGQGNARASTLDQLSKEPTYSELLPKLRATLDEAYKNGKVSDRVYKGITSYGNSAHKEAGI